MYSSKYQKPLSYTKYEQFLTISLKLFTFWILDKFTHSAQSFWRFLKISKVEFCIIRVFPMLKLLELHPLLRILNELHKHRTRNDGAIFRLKRAPSRHAFVKCLCNFQRFCRIKKLIQKVYVIFKNSCHRYYTNSEHPDLRCIVSLIGPIFIQTHLIPLLLCMGTGFSLFLSTF